jgi:hypothetical protein
MSLALRSVNAKLVLLAGVLLGLLAIALLLMPAWHGAHEPVVNAGVLWH